MKAERLSHYLELEKKRNSKLLIYVNNKLNETGGAPYYLNLSNTAKEFSMDDKTNPQNGLLETLSKSILIQEDGHTLNDIAFPKEGLK